MKQLATYLNFDGNCREAMTFYGKCLGADVQFSTFSEVPDETHRQMGDRIMHARLAKGSAVLMASDTLPGSPFVQGSNFSIAVECDSAEEIDRLFAAFSEEGAITMPLQDTFWGARFGMVTDQFGVRWMFNFELPKKA